MLNFNTRIKVLCSNTRVFGHGGIRHQVHNEVYEWLREVVPGTDWHERQIKGGYDGRGIVGKFFYFKHARHAVAFKLAWGGE